MKNVTRVAEVACFWESKKHGRLVDMVTIHVSADKINGAGTTRYWAGGRMFWQRDIDGQRKLIALASDTINRRLF